MISDDLFSDFINSFSYGTRNNLNFKFLSNFTNEEAADFLEELLSRMGTFLNDGNTGRMIEHIVKGQKQAYSRPSKYIYTDAPFTAMQKILSEAKIGLLTSSGHFVEGDDPVPFGISGMTQEEAVARIKDFLKEKPKLSVIPKETPIEKLRVRHGGYDPRGAMLDPDTVFPLETLKALGQKGDIKEVARYAYSFVGACAQRAVQKVAKDIWVDELKARQPDQPDALLLVPVWPVCHMSVGHAARIFEEAGIPTVIIAVTAFEETLLSMGLPRVLLTPFPMGRPMGLPGNKKQHTRVVTAALNLLTEASGPRTVTTLNESYLGLSG